MFASSITVSWIPLSCSGEVFFLGALRSPGPVCRSPELVIHRSELLAWAAGSTHANMVETRLITLCSGDMRFAVSVSSKVCLGGLFFLLSRISKQHHHYPWYASASFDSSFGLAIR